MSDRLLIAKRHKNPNRHNTDDDYTDDDYKDNTYVHYRYMKDVYTVGFSRHPNNRTGATTSTPSTRMTTTKGTQVAYYVQ